jgi:hypothetical protein
MKDCKYVDFSKIFMISGTEIPLESIYQNYFYEFVFDSLEFADDITKNFKENVLRLFFQDKSLTFDIIKIMYKSVGASSQRRSEPSNGSF